jgi:predicted RNA-binding protein with PUA domain
MTTATATTCHASTTPAAAATNNKNVSEPGTIHNKGTATSERDVLVIYAAVCVCAGGHVSKVRVTGPAKKHPCTTVVAVPLIVVVKAAHLALNRARYCQVTRCRVSERVNPDDVDTLR